MSNGHARVLAILVALIAILASTSPFAAELPPSSFASALLDVSQLPRFRPVSKVGSFSSYDRTGGNDDGFSGKYSYLRREHDGLVIAEVQGAGALTRIWVAAPVNDAPISFYFDGETRPRLVLPLSRLFRGDSPPFIEGLAGHALGGYYSYVPLEFAKSVKVVVSTQQFHFYMVNYVLYGPQVPVRTFRAGDWPQFPRLRHDGVWTDSQVVLSPGDSLPIFQTHEPGRILSLSLGPPEAFAGKDRAVMLRIYWDSARRPAIDVPVGDFFGYSFGEPATQSLLLGTRDGWNYVRFPMPFARSARIELADQRPEGPPLQVRVKVLVSPEGKRPDEGTLHAEWHRENPTTRGRSFTYLEVAGRGHLVGAILQSQGRELGDTSFFEGDEEALIDGEVTIHGTGSEDSFNGGWYGVPGRWSERRSLPLSGCLGYQLALSRTGGYRLFIGDAYSFHRSLRYTIEHGGEGNDVTADYVGTTFYYLDRPEGTIATPSAAAQRAVADPAGFVLPLLPAPPVAGLVNIALAPSGSRLGKEWVSFISLRASLGAVQPDAAGALGLMGQLDSASERITFGGLFGPPEVVLHVDVPETGDYAIFADGLTGPDGAMLALCVDGEAVGNLIDFYSKAKARTGPMKLADLHLVAGENLLHFSIPARNIRSSAAEIDLISVSGIRHP